MTEEAPNPPPSRRTSGRRTAASRWIFAVALAGAALAVGTVHTATLCVVTVLLAVAAVLAWTEGDRMITRRAATQLVFAGLLLTGFTALQCVPLPVGLLARIAPHDADVWSRALTPLHRPGPVWAPLTLDPIATRIECLKGIAYLLAFVTAIRLARRRGEAAFLGGVVVVTGVALAAAAVLHPAFGAHRLFGLYEPGPSIAERHIAPLMNPNNLAGYLNLSLCLALAAALSPEPVVPRAISGAVVLLLVATQIWVASRGGVVAMAVGAFVVVLIVWLSRARRQEAGAILSLAAGAAGALGALLIVLGGWEDASSELLQTDTSKLKMFREVMRMLPSVPIFGCGRGAFESAFPAFRVLGGGNVTFEYPENVIAQWVLEWGLPVGLAGLLAVAWGLRPSVVLARSTTAAGAWAGLAALALQNLGDLGSEIPGVMLAGVTCAAIVVAGSPGRAPQWRVERWGQRPRRIALLAAAGAIAGVALVVPGWGHELHADRRALHDAVMTRHVSVDAMHALVGAAMLRHPAEPYLPFATALRASFVRDESPLPWLGATLERASLYAPAHLLLARVVVPRSPSQARLEYRLTMAESPEFTAAVMSEAPRVVGSYFDATELVPDGPAGVPVLEELIAALKDRLPATCARLDEDLAARAPTKVGPVLRVALAAADDLEAGDSASWCAGSARGGCVRSALEDASRAQRMAPDACLPHAVKARVRVANGDGIKGLRELEAATDQVTDRVPCLQTLETMAQAARDEPLAEEVRARIVNAGCQGDTECARELAWVASQEETSGNPRKALALYKRAEERDPENDDLLENAARLASRVGLHAEAASDYERLARRHPTDARWKKAQNDEHDAAMRSAVKL